MRGSEIWASVVAMCVVAGCTAGPVDDTGVDIDGNGDGSIGAHDGANGDGANADGASSDTNSGDGAPASDGASKDGDGGDGDGAASSKACTNDGECASGLCVEIANGTKACAVPCGAAGTCPSPEWRCGPSTVAGGPNVCWPRFNHLCRPCEADADCRFKYAEQSTGDDSVCVKSTTTIGNLSTNLGSFCGATCDDSKPCPDGFKCGTVAGSPAGTPTTCVKADGACECRANWIGKGYKTSCDVTVASVGTCKGVRECSSTGALPACTARTPSAEVCNGVDDDCDGTVDEGGDTLCADDGLTCTTEKCNGTAGCGRDQMLSTCKIDDLCRNEGERQSTNLCYVCKSSSPSQWSRATDKCLINSVCYDANAISPLDPCDQCKPVNNASDWTRLPSACVIGNTCTPSGTVNPENLCQVCDPARNATGWSDKLDTCVINGACKQSGDTSAAGTCETCNPATSRSAWTLVADKCLISGQCYANGAANGALSCQVCTPSTSTSTWTQIAGTCFVNNTCYISGAAAPGNTCSQCLPCDTAGGAPAGAICGTAIQNALSKQQFTNSPSTRLCEGGDDTCRTASYCSGGTCPVRGYVQDANESNNTFSTPTVVRSGTDCDATGSSGSGKISSSNDVDWFRTRFSDETNCSVDPLLSVTSNGAIVRACAYARCTAYSNSSIDCGDGASDNSIAGWMGCCKTGTSPSVSYTPRCDTPWFDPNNSAEVKISISFPSSTAVCADYSWTTRF